MNKTAAQFALLLSLVLISSASAQQATPSTFTLPAIVAPPNAPTNSATSAATAVPAPATTTNAVVTVPGSQPMVMPLNIYTLPYGTVTIASGVYFIPNYENTGISIYIQSPAPLKIATLEEMVRYQAEWAQLTQQVTQTPAPPAQQAVAASTPIQGSSLAAPVTAAPHPIPVPTTQTVQAPAALPAAPVAVTSAPSFPSAAAAFSATLPSGGVQAFSMPTPTTQAQPSQATTPQMQAAVLPVAQATTFAQPQQAVILAAPTWSAPITLVPNYLRLNFRATGWAVSYSISNLSESASLQIDPRSLRVYQGGQPVEAQLTVRDSSTGTASGTLAPKAMLVGSVKALTRSGDALTLTWTARDAQGRSYPISYAWLPE